MQCHAVPETSWSTQSSTATNSFFNIFQTNWRNATKIKILKYIKISFLSLLFLPLDDSEHTLCYRRCDPDPKCLLLFEFDILRDLRAPMTGVWSWFQYKPNLAWDEMWFNSTLDLAKICWMRNIKPSWGSQPSSAHFYTFLECQAKFLKFGFSFEDIRLGYFQLAVWVIYIEHREIRDGSRKSH